MIMYNSEICITACMISRMTVEMRQNHKFVLRDLICTFARRLTYLHMVLRNLSSDMFSIYISSYCQNDKLWSESLAVRVAFALY
jgi:hypothetical protein